MKIKSGLDQDCIRMLGVHISYNERRYTCRLVKRNSKEEEVSDKGKRAKGQGCYHSLSHRSPYKSRETLISRALPRVVVVLVRPGANVEGRVGEKEEDENDEEEEEEKGCYTPTGTYVPTFIPTTYDDDDDDEDEDDEEKHKDGDRNEDDEEIGRMRMGMEIAMLSYYAL
ncbi:hypothetical protein M0804_002493 [Polistes exclamans]|nr:hypothetical protein M0804_002493 [Polistes exclamans]